MQYLLEAVHSDTYSGITPAVCRAVARVAFEHGILATHALELGREPAAVVLGPDDGVDAVDDPVGPAVLGERGRVGAVRALGVRLLELADVAEDPVARQLRHGLLLHVVVAQDDVGPLLEPVEPGKVALVALLEGNPLRVHEDRPRPPDQPVLAVQLRVVARHDLVQARPQVKKRERRAETTDSEIVVPREVLVLGHLHHDV